MTVSRPPPLRRLLRRFAALYLASRRASALRTRALLLAVPAALIIFVLTLHRNLAHLAPPPPPPPPPSDPDLPHITDPHALRAALDRVAFTPPSLPNATAAPPRLVVVTAVNHPFRSYLHNLFCSMRRHAPVSAARILVVALDADMQRHATRHGFESLLLSPHATAASAASAAADVHAFGSPGFNLLSKQKLYAVYLLLRAGVDVLFTDADVVWCADAAHAIAHAVYNDYPPRAPDLLMQTAWPRSLLNSGFYYARATADSVALFDAFMRYENSDEENDQVILNRVLCRAPYGGEIVLYNDSRSHPAAPQRPLPELCRWHGRAEARVLDAQRYPTGGELFHEKKIFHHPREHIMDMCERHDVEVLHNNCILSEKKLARFVVKGMWWVASEGVCRHKPAPATLEARRRCGVTKCGTDGDYRSFVHRQRSAAHTDGKLPSDTHDETTGTVH